MHFGDKEESSTRSFITNITEKDEVDEIQHIESRLDPGEEIIIVAKQSGSNPGAPISARIRFLSLTSASSSETLLLWVCARQFG